MEALVSTVVTLVQIVLGGFVAWGAWLILSFRAGSFSGAARPLVHDARRRGTLP